MNKLSKTKKYLIGRKSDILNSIGVLMGSAIRTQKYCIFNYINVYYKYK